MRLTLDQAAQDQGRVAAEATLRFLRTVLVPGGVVEVHRYRRAPPGARVLHRDADLQEGHHHNHLQAQAQAGPVVVEHRLRVQVGPVAVVVDRRQDLLPALAAA